MRKYSCHIANRSWLAPLLLSLTLSACGGADVRTQTNATTTGQELLDLKKAFDTGVITEKEYERKREEILDRD